MTDRDPNRVAARVVRIATGQDPTLPEDAERHARAVETGRAGGLKGGTARAETLAARQRSESARRAAMARWSKSRSPSKDGFQVTQGSTDTRMVLPDVLIQKRRSS